MAYNIMIGVVILSLIITVSGFAYLSYLLLKTKKLSTVTFIMIAPYFLLLPAFALAGLLYVAVPEGLGLNSALYMLAVVAASATAASVFGVMIAKAGLSRKKLQ